MSEPSPAAPAPELTGRTARWGRRAADLSHPIVVKEVRQALRSRRFTVWLIGICVYGAIVAIVAANEADTVNAIGPHVFTAYFAALLFVSCALVPVTAFFSFGQELDDGTLELVGITGLSASGILRGKLVSTLVQTALFISALLPFVTFAYLLQGVDILSILLLLGAAALESAWLVIYALFLAAMAPNTAARRLLGASLAFGTVLGVGAVASATFGLLEAQFLQRRLQSMLSDPAERWVLTGFAFMIVSYGALFFALGAGKIAFHGSNRSTAPRLILALQWIGATVALLFAVDARGGLSEAPAFYAALMLLQWHFVGVFSATESDAVSRRLLRERARKPFLLRLLGGPFFPGGVRGLIFSLTFSTATALLAVAMIRSPWNFASTPFGPADPSPWAHEEWGPILVFWLYSAAYICIPLLIARLLMPGASPKRERAFLFAALPAGLVVSGLATALTRGEGPTLLRVLNPFLYLDSLMSSEEPVAELRAFALKAWALVAGSVVALLLLKLRSRAAKRSEQPHG